MALTSLSEDLLHEYRAERRMVSEQIGLLSPLAASLRKPAATRLVAAGILLVVEILCYLLSVAGVLFVVCMQKIYPLSLLGNILNAPEFHSTLGSINAFYFTAAIYGLATLSVLLIFLTGRLVRVIRQKNAILYLAGKNIKIILGQHLERKAAHNTLEQRHMLDRSGIVVPDDETEDANEVLNPGF